VLVTKPESLSAADILEIHYGVHLSNRELEIGRLAISGMSTQDIAERTYLAVNTVKTHLKNLFRKTKAENRNDLYRKLVSLQFPGTDGTQTESTARDREPGALQKAARRDPATGLLHPLAFQPLCQSVLTEAIVRAGPVSVIRVVFDEGPTQEGCGRLTPEQGPVAIASVLLTSLRASDMLFRWNNLEFLVLLPDCGLTTAREIASRLVNKTDALARGRNISIRTTVGLASTEEGWKTAESLLDAAGQRATPTGRAEQPQSCATSITRRHRVS
jgi:DNA-binding CsgD family transcriptional regulator